MPGQMGLESLDLDAVRRLASYRGEPLVTSLYIDVDGRHRPVVADWMAAFEALSREARRKAAALGPLQEAVVDADLAAVERWLGASLDRSRTRGVAFFACSGDGFLRAFPLGTAVRDHLSLGVRPDLRQLVTALAQAKRYLVVMFDSQTSRLLDVQPKQVDELVVVADPIERRADTDVELGSWEHRREEAVRRHVRRVADDLVGHLDGRPVDGVVVSGPSELVDALLATLPPRASGLVAGRMALPMRSPDTDIERAVAGLAADLEDKRVAALVDEMRARVGTGLGVAGLEATLAALAERRVGTLLVDRDYSARGSRCPTCGRLGVSTRDCAWCGGPTEAVDDVVVEMVDEALAQHAAVEFCAAADLQEIGSVGAVERHR